MPRLTRDKRHFYCRWWPLWLTLLGAVFRFHALASAARFHPDEALFSTFARNAAVQGDWLLLGPLDKTPLTIYINALSMTLFGIQPLANGVLNLDIHLGEFAARLPGVFASILMIPLTYALAKRLYSGSVVPVLAAFLLAVSPFAIAFSATAFTDGLMLLGITLALGMISAHRWFWSGLWLALGFACKQQALFYLPLLLALGWGTLRLSLAGRGNLEPEAVGEPIYPYPQPFPRQQEKGASEVSIPPPRSRGVSEETGVAQPRKFEVSVTRLEDQPLPPPPAPLRSEGESKPPTAPPCAAGRGWGGDNEKLRQVVSEEGKKSIRLLAFFLPVLVCLLLLTAWDAARQQPVGIWALAAANNDPGRLLRSAEILPRLANWLDLAQFTAGPGWLTAGLGLVAVAGIFIRLRQESQRYSTLVDVLLAAYLLAYFLAHWLVAFNIYDRYWLPLLIPGLLLIARGVESVALGLIHFPWDRRARRIGKILTVPLCLCVFVLCLAAAWTASEGQLPIGGDQGKHTGIDDLAEYLNRKPLGTIIYDHWLGWELGYYLGAWSDKRRVYYPTPATLAADAWQQADPAPRYWVAPADQPITPWLDALQTVGFQMSLDWTSPRFVVYKLIPPPGVGGASGVGSSWPDRTARFADYAG